MPGKGGYAEPGQCGNDDRGANEIGRGGRQAHAEDQRRPHGQDEGYGQDTAGERDDPAGELQARTGEVQDADDDARGGTGGDKPHGLLGPVRETRHKLLGREPGALTQERAENRGIDGPDGRLDDRGVQADEHEDQHKDRDDQMPPLQQHLAGVGQLVLGVAVQPFFIGFKVDHVEDRDEIEDRRDDRGEGYVEIRGARQLGDDERRRPEDGRRHLPARGGHGFHGGGESRRVADLDHHGDGERPGGHHVGRRVAGNRTEQGTADDGHLGRPAALAAGNGHGYVDEELPCPGAGEERAEQEKEEYERGRRRQRCGQHTVHSGDVAENTREAVAPVPAKAIGKVFSEQRIGEEKDGDGGKNPAVGAPGHLEDQDDDNRGKEQVEAGGSHADAVDDRIQLKDEIDARRRRQQHAGPVAQRGHPLVGAPGKGVQEIGQHNSEADVGIIERPRLH